MARWSDLAVWRGPTPNQSGPGSMNRYDGQVTHIAAGWFEGTIAWQLNPTARVSSHFVVGRQWGQCAQMVDTNDAAWTQGDGNGEWISVENEGFLRGHQLWQPGWELLSPWQIECNARLFARGHREHGWPLQLTSHPTRKGLGYHGMGAENGYQWGHLYCPGEPIKAQLPLVLARAIEIVQGITKGKIMLYQVKGKAEIYVPRGDGYVHMTSGSALSAMLNAGHRIITVLTLADLEALLGKPYVEVPARQIVLAEEDREDIAARIAAKMPKPPTAQEIAIAVNDEDHRRSAA